MSNLVECKACKKELAKGVKKCPHCGKDQRNWFMRHKILSFIGAIIILIIIGIALGSGGDETSTTKKGETTKDAEDVYQIGDVIEVDNLEVAVTEFEEMDEIGDVDFLGKKASDGGTLIAIQYTMKNISDEPVGMFSYPTISLVDSGGTEYSTDIDASSAYAVEADVDNSKVLSDLNPDITITATDAYEVSKEKFAEGEWFIKIGEASIQIK